jgi:hypothetical protein
LGLPNGATFSQLLFSLARATGTVCLTWMHAITFTRRCSFWNRFIHADQNSLSVAYGFLAVRRMQ